MKRSLFLSLLGMSLLLNACSNSRSLHALKIAEINHKILYANTFQRYFSLQQLDINEWPSYEEPEKISKEQTLKNWVEQQILLELATQSNTFVSEQEVQNAYQQTLQQIPEEQFKQQLLQLQITASEFRKYLKEKIIIQNYLAEQVFARISVSDTDIQTYIQTHPKLKQLQEAYHLRHLSFRNEDRAEQVLRKLQAHVSFEHIVASSQQEPDFDDAQDLGWLTQPEIPQTFWPFLKSLSPGQWSSVITNSNGYHLIQIIEKRTAAQKYDTQIKEDAEHEIRLQKQQQTYAQLLQKSYQNMDVEIYESTLSAIH